MKWRVVAVEDHPVIGDSPQAVDRQSDRTSPALESRITHQYDKRLVEQCKPNLFLLDLRLKGGDWLDLIKTLRVQLPKRRCSSFRNTMS